MSDDSKKTLDRFLEQFWGDCEHGGARAKEDYLREFPGIEEAIDSHLAFLERRSAAASQSVGTDAFPHFARQTPRLSDGNLGRYRLISELGHGGQGAVYLAEDERLHRRVALKVLFGGLIHSAEARLRFEREAEATGRLNHPGIAKIYEMDEANGVPFIAMELIEGETLARRLTTLRRQSERESVTEFHVSFAGMSEPGEDQSTGRTKPSRPSSGSGTRSDEKALRSAAHFIEATALALHRAHESGLVHRDIKPGNIMVRLDQSPCILDFGLAHDEDSDGVTITATSDRFGTPAYMAPEQVRGKNHAVDRRSDVWALGATLYECCTLNRPFAAPTRDELFEKIKHEEPPAPRRLNPKIPRDLEAIILRALEKDQDRRYATAEDLSDDLRRFREHETVSARPVGPLVRSQRWLRRNKLVAITGTIVMLSLLSAAITFYVKGEESRRALEDKTAALSRESAALAAETKEREAKEAALNSERDALADKTKALEAAERERNEKTAALADREKALFDYDRLADVKRLEAAIAASASLYPPSPALVPRLVAWQRDHGSLAGKLKGHKGFLEELRAKALTYSDEDRKRDFATELAEIPMAKEALAAAAKAITETGGGKKDRKALKRRRSFFKKRLAELEELTTTGRRSWRFEDQSLQFQHDVLAELVTDLEAFATDETGALKSVAKWLEQSQTIASETLANEMAQRWSDCQERISQNAKYPGLDLKPQLGLVPLGPDPDSDLEEFLHWLTHKGPVPERDPKTKKVAVTEELGVVLVLIPAGSFLMGSQKDDPSESNYDPRSRPNEQPVNEVTLAPYFISKYEMTQGQWVRAFRANPSLHDIGHNHPAIEDPIDARHPVEQLSWVDAQRYLPQIDLVLPTEAEWERAARAGTSDQIYSGCSEISDLRRFGNINGLETKAAGFLNQEPGHKDEYILHAPVGSFLPNAFGLFDMTGNVWEWCLDGSCEYASKAGDRGLRRSPAQSRYRLNRGGGFYNDRIATRVAHRDNYDPEYRSVNLGIRPAKVITTL